MSSIVKDIGCRQAYDILQSRKPRATGGGLWGFRFWPHYGAGAPSGGTRIGESERRAQEPRAA